MNRREANELRQVRAMLEHGPGDGWRQALDGRQPGGAPTTLEERTRHLEIWLETWITPAIARVVERYWRPSKKRNRPLAPGGIQTRTARFRESLNDGEARQARADRGGEDWPYWVGYYQSIAKLAVERLEELEREACK